MILLQNTQLLVILRHSFPHRRKPIAYLVQPTYQIIQTTALVVILVTLLLQLEKEATLLVEQLFLDLAKI